MGDLRKQFEIWALSNKWNVSRFIDLGLDHYIDDFVNGAWVAFLDRQKKIDAAIAALERSKPLMMCQQDALDALKILKGD